mgnify:CR=1 FL=1
MGRPKKQISAKEPVRLREQMLSDGRRSLYLDIYFKGQRTYKFLKLYLLPGTDTSTKIANSNTLAQANAIKSEIIYDLTNKIAGITDKSHKAKMPFVEWLEIYHQTITKRGGDDAWVKRVINEIKEYDNGTVLADVDKEYILGFLERLLTRENMRRKGTKMKKETVFVYMDYIRAALNYAVKEKLLPTSPYKGISRNMVRFRQFKREYLTVPEIKKLIETPCRRQDIKDAFLFSCFCGLRIQDVIDLRWKHISKNKDDWQVEIVQFKTKVPLYLPLNMSARQWLPKEETSSEDRCFPKLSKDYHNVISNWVKEAGIDKHITYHTSRHTFATLCLTAGIDIYTTSQLLGHTSIRTTQRYARIINRKKDDAIARIDEVF